MKNKKIIAREIIIFFSIVVLLIIVFIGLELKNYYLKNEIKQQENELSTLETGINEIEKLNEFNEQTLIIELTKYAEQGATDDEMRVFRDKYYSKIKPWNLNYQYYLNGKPFTRKQIELYAKQNNLTFENYIRREEIEIKVESIKYSKYAFAEMIKQIFPEYKKVDNYELTAKIIAKYPIYESFITDKPYSQGDSNEDIDPSKEFSTHRVNFKSTIELQKLYEQKIAIARNLENTKINLEESLKLEDKTMLLFTIILFSLLYPIRLVIYLLKWSLKTIKEN